MLVALRRRGREAFGALGEVLDEGADRGAVTRRLRPLVVVETLQQIGELAVFAADESFRFGSEDVGGDGVGIHGGPR